MVVKGQVGGCDGVGRRGIVGIQAEGLKARITQHFKEARCIHTGIFEDLAAL